MKPTLLAAACVVSVCGCAVDVEKRSARLSDYRSASVRELCSEFAASKSSEAETELRSRNVFTDADWKRIHRGQTNPTAMSEQVLWCAWGLPGSHGDIDEVPYNGATATRYRYAVPSAAMSWDIVVRNGLVVAWRAL